MLKFSAHSCLQLLRLFGWWTEALLLNWCWSFSCRCGVCSLSLSLSLYLRPQSATSYKCSGYYYLDVCWTVVMLSTTSIIFIASFFFLNPRSCRNGEKSSHPSRCGFPTTTTTPTTKKKRSTCFLFHKR